MNAVIQPNAIHIPGAWIAVLVGFLLLVLAGLLVAWRRQARLVRRLATAQRDRDVALASITDNVTLVDTGMRIVWANWSGGRSACSLNDPIPGEICHTVVAGRDEPCVGCPVPEVLRTGETAEGEVTCNNGRIMRMTASPVRDENGELIGVTQCARDITEQRRMAERLRQAQKMEAVGQLAAGVAHDFNNGLQVILGYTEMLAAELDDRADLREYTGAVLRAGNQARDVVGHLLAFSRNRGSCAEMVDLGAALTERLDPLRRLMGPDIDINLSVEPDLPLVAADPARMEQVILNLCVNARDAMPDGGRLDLRLTMATLRNGDAARVGAPAPGDYVRLHVEDTGEGIAPEVRDRVFDPFFTTRAVGRGRGLGLATVYGIVSAHQGYIELDSEPGRGTEVRIGWPAAATVPAAQPVEAAAATVIRKARILVAEDSRPVRDLAVAVLKRQGHEVATASDGREALSMLLQQGDRFDVVVMDVVLPGLDGWTVYSRASAVHPRLRAVFCSGHSAAMLKSEFQFDAPDVQYLQKPYSPADLATRIQEILTTDGHRAGESRA